jgi:hypothetical protein
MADNLSAAEIQKLKDRLDEIAEGFWSGWKVWLQAQGWTLGPDRPDLQMNPYLVDDYAEVSEEGRKFCRAQVALVLHSVSKLPSEVPKTDEPVETMKPKMDRNRALKRLNMALAALTSENLSLAEEKLNIALKSVPSGFHYDVARDSILAALKQMNDPNTRARAKTLLMAAINRLENDIKDGADAPVASPVILKKGKLSMGMKP